MAQGERNGRGPLTPLIWVALGGWLGFHASPVEDSGALLGLSTVIGALLLWAVALYKEGGVKLAGTRNPYATDRESMGGLLASVSFPLAFLIAGLILMHPLKAGAGLDTTPWLPIWSILLGIAAAGLYRGRALRRAAAARPAAPWAFVYFSYLLFFLFLAGLLVCGSVLGEAPWVGSLAGASAAVAIWAFWFAFSKRRSNA